MDSELWQPVLPTIADEHVEELRGWAGSTLARPGVVWRRRAEEEPIFVRVLSEADLGATFVSPVPVEPGEDVEFAREAEGARRRLHVARCELLGEDVYRVSAHV